MREMQSREVEQDVNPRALLLDGAAASFCSENNVFPEIVTSHFLKEDW